ncbi:MAG: putative integral rane protein [Thermoleophilia bacterium]|nr:putative integral rane protein [Thermoleophilia bacterium]
MTNLYFFAHMVGLVLLAAGIGVANYSGIMVGVAKRSSEIALWSRVNYRIEHIATLPGALVLLVSGILMVEDRGYSFGDAWITAAFGLWVLAVVIGAGVLGRHAKKVHRAATEAVAAGREDDPEVIRLSSGPLGPILGNLLNLIVVAFLYVMIYKPGM